MAEGGEAGVGLVNANAEVPLRMADVSLHRPLPDTFPMAEGLNTIRIELMFHWKLLRSEWTRVYYSTVAFGVVALFLGSVSPELWGGGDAKISGIDGILAINGSQFFQMLVSFICWGWFAYQAMILFPVMRVHAISLLLMWNGLVGAQVLFHQNNPSFPLGFELADMMGGTLIVLVVFFFLFFFWKAVVETRDLHVEVNLLHEDVRVMEEALAEHSLRGWSAMFGVWVFLIMVSSWAGLHHVASYGESNIAFLVIHIITGLPAVPLLLFVLWYPQHLLGAQNAVRTRAAVDASLEMSGQQPNMWEKLADIACPECGASTSLKLNKNGELTHPCNLPGCTTHVMVGTNCTTCQEPMPSRIDCPACGVNAPALDYMPDQDVW